MAIQVFFESTTPLLHLLGCLKLAGRAGGRLYLAAGAAPVDFWHLLLGRAVRDVFLGDARSSVRTCFCKLAVQGASWHDTA